MKMFSNILMSTLRLRPSCFTIYVKQNLIITLGSYKIKLISTSTFSTSRNLIKTLNFVNKDHYEAKKKIISTLNFQSQEDAAPFYNLPTKKLIHIYTTTQNDVKNGYCKNRLYYISNRIKCNSTVLSEHLAKRTFVYSLSFDWIEKSLDVLLDKNVPSDRILRDLWVLKYHHITIRSRLERILNLGINNLYPWMVRCSEDILQRYIEISQETKNILGETKSTQMYLADRLNTSLEVVEEMCIKMPALKTIRVTKVKNFLDFLISEGFHVEDITQKPRVLAASQKTVKDRLEKLRRLGIDEINLNILCRSRKDFKRYCESIESELKESDADNTIKL